MINQVYVGDVLDFAAQLPPQSVQTIVTSPPYFGLRSYLPADHPDKGREIGGEPTPAAFVAALVAVFRALRPALKDDGTLWLNLGDSYAMGTRGAGGQGKQHTNVGSVIADRSWSIAPGLKPKDLIGIPWSVAKALQQPFYSGRIASELDRVWLAATIDAEGTICGFTHERKDDGTTRTGIHITITNSNMALLDNAHRIWPTSRADHNAHGDGHLGGLPTRRWVAHDIDAKSLLLRELYPYLIAKKKQALLAYNFLEISKTAKRSSRQGESVEAKDRRSWLVQALSRLNHAEDVDVPSWCVEPPSLYEPGYYLRSDIIWHKPNPMPESVTDRPTRSHEYIFLLSKSARYFYDADAIREPHATADRKGLRISYPAGSASSHHLDDGHRAGRHGPGLPLNEAGRNKRDVWTVPTVPYPDAHYATFPPELIRPCILAGSRPAGKRCDCAEVINTPTGMVANDDPSLITGRAGMNRPRNPGEGSRPITRREQRWHAQELRLSPHRAAMERQAGDAFAHYIRTDRSGARPIPPDLHAEWSAQGWITNAPPCDCPIEPADVVCDPFGGSGTTALVAVQERRQWVTCDLDERSVGWTAQRLSGAQTRLGVA